MNIPFIDFRPQYEAIKEEIDIGVKKVFEKGNFILGEEAQQFETQFAQYCESRFGVGVNSGTDALYLAVAALGIDQGDEVILPTHTFIATALCVSYTGATPVFADVEETTYNLDVESFEKAITKKTKAVIPVHIYGQCANMDEINAVAKKHGIKVIEDAAQAHGALYKGKRIGSLGDVACFSFYPTKSLGAFGDAGMVVTADEKIANTVKMLRDYGRVGRYEHKVKGFNTRLDTIQAVILSAKLKRLDPWNQMRNDVAKQYAEYLHGIPGVILPPLAPNRTHVYQTFAVRVKKREQVMEELKKRGINVLIHYPIPIHLQEAYRDAGYTKGAFPVAEKVAEEILSLPMFPHMTREQVKYVAENLKEALK